MSKKGIWLGIGAFMIWGLFPLYWKLLHNVPALQLLNHRIVWSFVALLVFLVLSKQLKGFKSAVASWKTIGVYFLASLLIAINWFTYVWAVNDNRVVECSLGYFINPLFSVLLGMLFFKERMRKVQQIALLITLLGVVYMTIAFGKLPWIALVLATSFASYGFIKKMAPLNTFYGLTLETLILLIPATVLLLSNVNHNNAAFGNNGVVVDLLLVGGGVVTVIPLLMFSSAAKLVPLSLIGLMQYIGPTIQFIIGRFVYNEPFLHHQLIGYSLVWFSLFIFALEGYWVYRRQKTA